MSKFTEKVKSIFRRRKPMTRQDAAEVADWVNEGGAFDPEGPPRVIDNGGKGEGEAKRP